MRRLLCGGIAILGLACGRAPDPPPERAEDPLAPLHAFEEERRLTVDFAHLPPSDHALGPDPIALQLLPGSDPPLYAGLLRGRDAVVLLDAELREIARAPAPGSPTGLAVAAGGDLCVTGEASPRIACYAARDRALVETSSVTLPPPTFGLRDVALAGPREARWIYAVDEREDALIAVPPGGRAPRTVPACAGAFRLAQAGEALIVDCLLDHRLAVFDAGAGGLRAGAPRAAVQHDGPIWSVAAAEGDGLWIAAGGVEDHPLDRREGSFGFIDSFVFLYRLAPGARTMDRVGAVNVSEHGVITPKALSLRLDHGAPRITVTGYGADRIADITFPAGPGAPAVTTRPALPGIAAMAPKGDGWVFADPLLDAFIDRDPVPVPDSAPPRRGTDSLLGEALFFTHLMAPWDRSDGRLSRFTCETCHFEGHVDGRTHHTGRGDVRATTKTLHGLFNNRPYFSRALDPTMAGMVDNEFRVAGANSGHPSRFAAADAGLAWLPSLGLPVPDLDAVRLRRALMTFLMDLTPRANPKVIGRDHLDARERRGAEVFADRCERCHEARLIADVASSRVPPSTWEPLILSREGPIVWAREGYHRTGVEPYVHEQGARAPSLRRVYRKRPYFTNGSARSLRDVILRARWTRDAFFHDHAPEGAEGIADGDREALEAFLSLL